MTANLRKEVQVGKNILVGADFGFSEPELKHDLEYGAHVILDAPGEIAYKLHHNIGIVGRKVDNRELEERQSKAKETFLRLQTAMLERAWLVGDRELVEKIRGGR